jgi:hypothetical protein
MGMFFLWELTASMIKLMQKKYKFMKFGLIKTEEEYNNALQRLEKIFDAKNGTKKATNSNCLAC